MDSPIYLYNCWKILNCIDIYAGEDRGGHGPGFEDTWYPTQGLQVWKMNTWYSTLLNNNRWEWRGGAWTGRIGYYPNFGSGCSHRVVWNGVGVGTRMDDDIVWDSVGWIISTSSSSKRKLFHGEEPMHKLFSQIHLLQMVWPQDSVDNGRFGPRTAWAQEAGWHGHRDSKR